MSHPLRRHIEKITPLSDEEFAYILSHFAPKRLRKHQFLIQDTTPVTHEFFVVKGCLRAYNMDKTGKEHILQFALEDWWISDYLAFVNQTPASLNIDCLDACELLGLSLYNKEKLCSEMHKLEHFFRVKLTANMVAMQQRILAYLNQTTQERYDNLMALYPQLFQRVPKQYIAAYLGVSRETLSRLRSS